MSSAENLPDRQSHSRRWHCLYTRHPSTMSLQIITLIPFQLSGRRARTQVTVLCLNEREQRSFKLLNSEFNPPSATINRADTGRFMPDPLNPPRPLVSSRMDRPAQRYAQPAHQAYPSNWVPRVDPPQQHQQQQYQQPASNMVTPRPASAFLPRTNLE